VHAVGEFFFEIRQGLIGMVLIAAVLVGAATAGMAVAIWIRESALFRALHRSGEAVRLDAEFAEDFD